MTKPKSKRNRILLITAIVIVAGLGIWYATRAKSSTKKTASTTTTKTDVANTDEANKNDPTLDQKKASTTTTSSSNSKNITIMISRPVNNDTVPLSEGIEVRSVVSGTSSGTCNLTATGPGGKTITKTASVTEQNSYGSCSFDIASSEVVAGQWQLALSVTSGDSTAKINTTVKVQ